MINSLIDHHDPHISCIIVLVTKSIDCYIEMFAIRV